MTRLSSLDPLPRHKPARFLVPALLLASSVWLPGMAQAKDFSLLNSGQELFEVAAEPLLTTLGGEDWKLGYRCAHFGLLGADLLTWDCEMVAVNLRRGEAIEIPEPLLSEYQRKYSFSDVKRGIWNRYGIWFLLTGLFGLSALGRRRQAEPAAQSVPLQEQA